MKYTECYQCSERINEGEIIVDYHRDFFCSDDCVLDYVKQFFHKTRLHHTDCDQEDEENFPEDDEE